MIEIVSLATSLCALYWTWRSKSSEIALRSENRIAESAMQQRDLKERIEDNRGEIKRLRFVCVTLLLILSKKESLWDYDALRRHLMDTITGDLDPPAY